MRALLSLGLALSSATGFAQESVQQDAPWEQKDLVLWGALSAGVLFTLAHDAEIQKNFQRSHTPFLSSVARGGEVIGNGVTLASISAATLAAGFLADHPPLFRAGLYAAESLALAGVSGWILKGTFHRYRPYESGDPYRFDGPAFSTAHFSFPSGHTLSAFAVAASLSMSIDETWASALLYSVATLAAFSRVYENQHWASDTVAGAMVGIASAKLIHWLNKDEDDQPQARRILLLPEWTHDTRSLRLIATF